MTRPPHLRVVEPGKSRRPKRGAAAAPPTEPPQPPPAAGVPALRFRLPPGPGFLETIGEWVNRPAQPEAGTAEQTSQAVTTVLERYRDELAAFKVALGRREAAVMTETLKYYDEVRYQLMEKANPADLDLLQLQNMIEMLHRQIKLSNDMIVEAVEGPRPTLHLDVRKALMAKLDAELPSTSRDRLRRLFKWMLESPDLDKLLQDPDDGPAGPAA